jgi:hypothetical protein
MCSVLLCRHCLLSAYILKHFREFELVATWGAPRRISTGFPPVPHCLTTDHAVYQPTPLVSLEEPVLVFLTSSPIHGQTERQNRTLEQYLRAYDNDRQDDSVYWLPMVEFA